MSRFPSAATAALALALSWSACASQPPLAAHLDPSNPDAPEAPPTAASDALSAAAPSKPATAPGPGYDCPMHPEVTSDQPGTCPKCGMKLVPTQPAARDAGMGGDDHRHHGAHP